MKKGSQAAKLNISGVVMYWTVGILLVLMMLSIWLVSGLFARYTASGSTKAPARVASTGMQMNIWEHKAAETEKNSGVYELLTDEDPVLRNRYKKVLPGVDIPKDPYVDLKLSNSEVDYELYIEVTEIQFPYYTNADDESVKAVTYTVEDIWELQEELSDIDNGVYVFKYTEYLDAHMEFDEKLPILVNDTLYVSEHYVGDGEFRLAFRAWIQQID